MINQTDYDAMNKRPKRSRANTRKQKKKVLKTQVHK